MRQNIPLIRWRERRSDCIGPLRSMMQIWQANM